MSNRVGSYGFIGALVQMVQTAHIWSLFSEIKDNFHNYRFKGREFSEFSQPWRVSEIWKFDCHFKLSPQSSLYKTFRHCKYMMMKWLLLTTLNCQMDAKLDGGRYWLCHSLVQLFGDISQIFRHGEMSCLSWEHNALFPDRSAVNLLYNNRSGKDFWVPRGGNL